MREVQSLKTLIRKVVGSTLGPGLTAQPDLTPILRL